MNDNRNNERLHRKTRPAIPEYLQKRDGHQMVTASDTLVYLRGRFSLAETSDLFLANVVAGEAIILGLDVELDNSSSAALFDRWPRSAANNNDVAIDQRNPGEQSSGEP